MARQHLTITAKVDPVFLAALDRAVTAVADLQEQLKRDDLLAVELISESRDG